MIPVLYKANVTDFSTFGIGALSETISCIVTEERNGAFECVLKYPHSGLLYKEIKKERIIKAKPNDTKAPQAFRIYKITTPINGIITIYAQHISYDLSGIGVMPFTLTNTTPTQAIAKVLNEATTDHNFTFQTDYSSAKDYVVDKPKSIRACLGGEQGSLLSLWGGEFEWNNFQIIHHQGRGEHTAVVIEYGKNLTKLDHSSDNADVYTDLLPYAVITENDTETVVTLEEQTLPITDTELLAPKTYILDMTSYFDEGEEITETKLRNIISNNNIKIGTILWHNMYGTGVLTDIKIEQREKYLTVLFKDKARTFLQTISLNINLFTLDNIPKISYDTSQKNVDSFDISNNDKKATEYIIDDNDFNDETDW